MSTDKNIDKRTLYIVKESGLWSDDEHIIYCEKPEWCSDRNQYLKTGGEVGHDISWVVVEQLVGRELLVGEMAELVVEAKHVGYYVT